MKNHHVLLYLKKEESKYVTTLLKVARASNYRSAGTIEFLVTEDAHYFIEMNARIQVEHTVTEMRADRDLLQAQLYLLQHDELPFQQEDIVFNGHVIEARMRKILKRNSNLRLVK